MRALDLFCSAGGASMGLFRAGYIVEGVDIDPQPNYPFRFTRTDATECSVDFLREFDLVWASPPCQQFTAYRRKGHGVGNDYPNLIPATRELLRAAGVPYIIENVVGAPLESPVMLCGSMFGLDVQRHRLFETSSPVLTPTCNHGWWTPRYPPAANRTNLRKTVEVGVWRIPLETQQGAMGIDWMTREELSQAIPPAYAEYLARRMGTAAGDTEGR